MVSRINQVAEFYYRAEDGASIRRRVLVLSESDDAIGGIDLGKLGDNDRDRLQEAATRYRAEVERVFPDAYRRFLRSRMGPRTHRDRMREWAPEGDELQEDPKEITEEKVQAIALPIQGAQDNTPVEIPYTAPPERDMEAPHTSFMALTGRETDYWMCPRCSMKVCPTEDAAKALGGGVMHKPRSAAEDGRCPGCGYAFQTLDRRTHLRHTTYPTRL